MVVILSHCSDAGEFGSSGVVIIVNGASRRIPVPCSRTFSE